MRWVGYVATTVLLGLLVPTAAFAHDEVVGTSPRNGEEVAALPEEVRIDLGERPRSGSGSVTGPNGQELRRGEVEIDARTLVIPVRSAARRGIYEIEFRAVSRDGHPVVGSLSFALVRQRTASPSPSGEQPLDPLENQERTDSNDAGGDDAASTVSWIGLVVAAGAAIAGVVIAGARSRRSTR